METLASPQTFKFGLARFTPAELEKITGLSTPMQGDWRARGYLPKSKKHARFDAFAVAEIWVMKMMADRGIGPKLTAAMATECADAIVCNSLGFSDNETVLAGEHDEIFAWLPHERRPAEQWLREHGTHVPNDIALSRAKGWERQQQREWLTAAIFGHLGRSVNLRTDVVWWPTGEIEFNGLSAFENRKTSYERFAGAAIVLDLAALGDILVARAGRPLARFWFDDDVGVREARG